MTQPTTNGHISVEKDSPAALADERTVQVRPLGITPFSHDVESTLFWVAQQADDMEPWGRSVKLRDQQLRAFIPVEPFFNSALGIVVARNSAFSWKLQGPPRLVVKAQRLLQTADFGRGWAHFISKISLDLYTQDSGAFFEVIREANDENAQVVGLAHLDAARCYPTGIPEAPVVYLDRRGEYHYLKWYQVVHINEIPATYEGIPGLQYCALTRMMRAVKIARDISIYISEKVGGRNARAITAIKGITPAQLADALTQARNLQDAAGFMRYSQPIIVGAVDPKADVGFETLELASIPDGFDLETTNRWYISQIAMAFLSDYQEFAPMPGTGLGTATQSEVMHLKSRGKGPGLFMKIIAEALNWNVLPESVEFSWSEQDPAADQMDAQTRLARAQERKTRIDSTELTPQVAREIAHEHGDLTQEQMAALAAQDLEDEATIVENQPADEILQEGGQAAAQNNPNPNSSIDDATPPVQPSDLNPKPSIASQLGVKAAGDKRAGGGPVSDERLDVEDDVEKVIQEAFALARAHLLQKVSGE